MSYGPNSADLYEPAGEYGGKFLELDMDKPTSRSGLTNAENDPKVRARRSTSAGLTEPRVHRGTKSARGNWYWLAGDVARSRAAAGGVAADLVAAKGTVRELYAGPPRAHRGGVANARDTPRCVAHRQTVRAGGLLFSGPETSDIFRRVGVLHDRIVYRKGPAELSTPVPIKFEFAIDLTPAATLELTVLPPLTALADEVIE